MSFLSRLCLMLVEAHVAIATPIGDLDYARAQRSAITLMQIALASYITMLVEILLHSLQEGGFPVSLCTCPGVIISTASPLLLQERVVSLTERLDSLHAAGISSTRTQCTDADTKIKALESSVQALQARLDQPQMVD